MDGADAGGWSLSLVIPAFNEEAGIRQAVHEADAALAALAADYEILVVDDGSTDGTAAAVAEMTRDRPHVRLLSHSHNRGYGAALRSGFEAARFSLVAFTDADCQFDLNDLASLVPLTDRHDIAAGFRMDRQDPWRRRFVSWGYNVVARALLGTGVRDCDCALKVFRKDALRDLLPETRGFFVNSEMLARARQLGLAVAEAGVRHRPRVRGTSTVSLRDIPRTLASLLPFWWSRLLFAGRGAAATGEHAPAAGLARLPVAVSVLLLVAALLFFSRLRCPLLEPDEARYAEIPRQMLAEGHVLVPVLHGTPYYHKPPLLYWLVMGSYAVFGVDDWAARLVPCSCALLTVLITYLWGRRAVGPRAAFAGGLMLALSVRFIYLGRMLTMDSLLCLWVVAALASAHAAVRGRGLRWRWWLLSAAACGLGLLTKGPVALVLVIVPVLLLQWLDPRTSRPRWRAWLAYCFAAVGVACPWYLAVTVSDPVFAQDFFWTHNVLRYVAPLDHEKPFWFYLPDLLLGMLPWTLLLYPLLRFLGSRSKVAAERRPAALGFFLLACLSCLLFYSAGGCKRAGYILPAMPPLALALGWYLDVALADAAWRRAGAVLLRQQAPLARWAVQLVLVLALGGSILTAWVGMQRPASGAAVATAAAAGLWCLRRRGPGPAGSWVLCGAVTFAVLLAAVHQVLPGYTRKFSIREQVRPQLQVSATAHLPVVCYPHRWDSVSFYLRRNDVHVYTPAQRHDLMALLRAQPDTLVFVKSDDATSRNLTDFLEALPGCLEFVPRSRSGIVTAGLVHRRSDTGPAGLARGRNDELLMATDERMSNDE